MKVLNYCKHAVRILNQESGEIDTINSSGVAVCSSEETAGPMLGPYGSVKTELGQVTGLPGWTEGTVCIVPAIVVSALRGLRYDVFNPDSGVSAVRFKEDCKEGKSGQIDYVVRLTR